MPQMRPSRTNSRANSRTCLCVCVSVGICLEVTSATFEQHPPTDVARHEGIGQHNSGSSTSSRGPPSASLTKCSKDKGKWNEGIPSVLYTARSPHPGTPSVYYRIGSWEDVEAAKAAEADAKAAQEREAAEQAAQVEAAIENSPPRELLLTPETLTLWLRARMGTCSKKRKEGEASEKEDGAALLRDDLANLMHTALVASALFEKSAEWLEEGIEKAEERIDALSERESAQEKIEKIMEIKEEMEEMNKDEENETARERNEEEKV